VRVKKSMILLTEIGLLLVLRFESLLELAVFGHQVLLGFLQLQLVELAAFLLVVDLSSQAARLLEEQSVLGLKFH